MPRIAALVALGFALLGPSSAQAEWLDQVGQRVQDSLQKQGTNLAALGYAMDLTETSSTTVRVRLTRADGGPEPEKNLTSIPREVDAAAVEVGIAVVSMLPKHDGLPEEAPVRTQRFAGTDDAAVSADPPSAKPGAGLNEGDRYYLGLSFSIAIGFGTGHYIAPAPKGWLFTILDLGTAVATGVAIARVADGHRETRDIGFIVGGAVAFAAVRLWELIDLLTFDPEI